MGGRRRRDRLASTRLGHDPRVEADHDALASQGRTRLTQLETRCDVHSSTSVYQIRLAFGGAVNAIRESDEKVWQPLLIPKIYVLLTCSLVSLIFSLKRALCE